MTEIFFSADERQLRETSGPNVPECLASGGQKAKRTPLVKVSNEDVPIIRCAGTHIPFLVRGNLTILLSLTAGV
jgi:hypothetical protein